VQAPRSGLSRLAIALGGAALAALLSAGSAAAAITVANTNDSGLGSLRQALLEAPPGETIVVPAGTYTLASPLEITKGVTLSGHAAADTIVRAGGTFNVITFSGEFDAAISGVTIRDGNVTGGTAFGGGIYAQKTNLTLRDVTLTHNTVSANGAAGNAGGSSFGGAIFSQRQLTLIDSRVTDNTATSIGGSGKGGGLAFGGGIFSQGSLTIQNSTLSGNRALAMGGSGPVNAGQAGGSAYGGGLFSQQVAVPAGAMTGITVSGNVADASGGPGGAAGTVYGGGAFQQTGAAAMSLVDSTVTANVSRSSGSASGSVSAGGFFAQASTSGSINLLSDTISGNRAEPATSTIGGGNLYMEGPVNAGNTIVSGGAGPPGTENCKGGAASLGFNLDSLDQCGFHFTGDQVNKDPLLGPLQDNGGPTQTLAPAAASPVVDQGTDLGPTSDQRGVVRPIDLPTIANAPGGDGSDIGAVELQPSHDLTIGKLKKNKAKGTATLEVTLPGPSAGTLTLGGKGLKSQTKAIAGQTSLKLKVIATGSTLKALRKRGKRKVKIKVTYTPTGNSALTKTRSTKLIRKPKKRRKRP
jgi:hypothetical protein